MCATSSKSICAIVLATSSIGALCGLPPHSSWEVDVDGSLLEKMIGNTSLLQEITELHNVSASMEFRKTILKHVAQIEPTLRPILAILPSNQHGKFDSPAIRYVLHRFFVQHRGWVLEGLDPEGEAWNSSSADKVVALKRLSKEGRGRLARRLGHQGLTSDDVITLGAAIEMIVHYEAQERFVKVFNMAGFSSDRPLSEEQAELGLEYYISLFIMNANLSLATLEKMHKVRHYIELQYPAWPTTKGFIYDVAAKAFGTTGSAQNFGKPADFKNVFREYNNTAGLAQHFSRVKNVNFSQVASAVEQITYRYALWQNYECLDLKRHLVSMEDRGTGRVRLADFYRVAIAGKKEKWRFTESVPFLREAGALDESNPNNLLVIIPNYVNGATNCDASSKYLSVCCISECWDVFDQIETALGAATATPQDISAAVAKIPSSTVPANRSLDDLSLIRLQSIAAGNGGVVSIHGRLFAQWLHHVYPRECDFPHRAGTTQPKDIYDMRNAKENFLASSDDMKKFAANNFSFGAPVEIMAWSHDEEWLVAPRDHADMHPYAWLKVQLLATCAALFAMAMGLTRTFRLACRRSKVVLPPKATQSYLI